MMRLMLRAALVGIFCWLAFAPAASATERQIPSLPADAHTDVAWSAARLWLQSADCARVTKVILVVCSNGQLIPLANVNPGDDPGHALALGLYSAVTGNAVQPSDILSLNKWINISGTILLAALLYSMGLPFASLLLVTVGTYAANQYNEIAPHPAQYGLVALTTILPLALLGMRPDFVRRRKTVLAWLAIGVLGIGVATLFRQSIGLMGVASSILALVAVAIKGRTHFTAIAVLTLAVMASYQSPSLVFRARDAVYHLTASNTMEQHGIWHNIYLGLGVVDNDFGISWNDSVAFEHAQRINPKVVWGTTEYYETLRGAYFKLVLEHPLSVTTIYAKKLQLTLQQTLPWIRFLPLGYLLLGLATAAAFTRFFLQRGFLSDPSDALLSVGAVYICFFLGQAVLFHFLAAYLFPIQLFLILVAAAILEFALKVSADLRRKPTLRDTASSSPIR